MDNIAGQKSSLSIVTNIAVFVIVLAWLIPTVGLFVSSFRDRDQISASGWWVAPFSVELTYRTRADATPTRDGDAYVPFTKAYSGLTDAEFGQITKWVRANTLQRFGPMRQVPPAQVFEIAFEGIAASPRHKSGVALRFPRMLRWRQDKPLAEIATLDELREILRLHG